MPFSCSRKPLYEERPILHEHLIENIAPFSHFRELTTYKQRPKPLRDAPYHQVEAIPPTPCAQLRPPYDQKAQKTNRQRLSELCINQTPLHARDTKEEFPSAGPI